MQRLALYFLKRVIVTATIIAAIVLVARGDGLSPGLVRGFVLLVLAGVLLGVARLARLWAFHSHWGREQAAKGRMRLFGNASMAAIAGFFILGLLQLVIAEIGS